jgi:uncharacterized protein (DUF433 family)
MATTVVPINLIEITESFGKKVPRVSGTRIRVSEIVIMHLLNDSSIDWIVENFEVLDHAKVHAALAYYYSHKEEIDAEINAPQDTTGAMSLEDLKEKIRRRNATQ